MAGPKKISIASEPAPFTFALPPAHGELPYSVAARYREVLSIPVSSRLVQDCFGIVSQVSPTLTRNVERFTRVMYGSWMSADDILQRHTAFPYIASFLDEVRRVRLRKSMMDGTAGHGSRQNLSGTTVHDHLAFCPECAAADKAELGQSTWKRAHQLQGVFLCPVHGTSLRLSDAPARAFHLITCPTDPAHGRPLANPMSRDLALAVSRWVNALLGESLPACPPKGLPDLMKSLILQSGWAWKDDKVAFDFSRHVVNAVGGGPEVWGSATPEIVQERVRSVWSNSAAMGSPFAHVAVASVLGIEPHQLRSAILARFAGDTSSPQRNLASSGQFVVGAKVARHRRVVLQARAEKPNASRRQIWNSIVPSCRYLLRHDRAWLKANLPEKVFRPRRSDEELADTVAAAAEKLRDAAGMPTRISVSRLAAAVRGKAYLLNHQEHFPLTMAALELHSETHEEGLARRFEWQAWRHVREGTRFHRAEIRVQHYPHLARWALTLPDLVAEALCHGEPAEEFARSLARWRTQMPQGDGLSGGGEDSGTKDAS